MKNKIKLHEFDVQSFVTSIDKNEQQQIFGGQAAPTKECLTPVVTHPIICA